MQKKTELKTTDNFLTNTPQEILLLIFSFLPAKEKISSGLVCKLFLQLSRDNSLWDSEIKKTFGLRQLNELKTNQILLFEGYKKYSKENQLLIESKLDYDNAKKHQFLVDVYINTDTKELKLIRADIANKGKPINFDESYIPSILKKALNCNGYDNISLLLRAIRNDAYCPKLICKYFIGSDKAGYLETPSYQINQLIEKIDNLANEEISSKSNRDNSRCLIS